jgi:hypothetical protein
LACRLHPAALVAEKMPKVAAKLNALKVPLEPLTIQWFLCCLVNTLPLEVNPRSCPLSSPLLCSPLLSAEEVSALCYLAVWGCGCGVL